MDESVNKELPQIIITSVDVDESGQAQLSFEVDDELLEYIKKEKNIKDVDQKTLSEFVNNLLTKCASNEDGYEYTKLNSDKTD
jgi:hypothetical protein